ncbi:MAG: amidase [Bryobacteraceae bacterium]
MLDRRTLLLNSLLAGCAAQRTRAAVENVSLTALAAALARGDITSVQLVNAYLERIQSIDRSGPRINSVIEINPDALDIARQRDAGPPRGPLHGLPILIKDNIDTADRMHTTAGSLALIDAPRPERDAPLVKRLRDAGAVILGKTNLSEWANIRSTRSTSGWSGRGGQTRNPHAPERNPSGSSSGSGAAVAASLCAAAVGTETDGSIVSPSSINGIVGIKPTLGLISQEGIIPIAHSQDTAGPMARTVTDAALLLSAMNERGLDFQAGIRKDALRGVRLGVARQFFGGNPDVVRLAERAIELCRRAGAEIVDPVELPQGYGGDEFTVLKYELKADLSAYLAARGGPVASLKQVIEFNERERGREMPHFGQETFIAAEALGGLDSKPYLDALRNSKRMAGRDGIDAAMDQHKLDAIVSPTDGPAWLTDYVNGDHYGNTGCSTPPAVAGYPHVTLPAGLVHGLPVGFSFFGRANTDQLLVNYAVALEAALP